jgi:hypothetical protein
MAGRTVSRGYGSHHKRLRGRGRVALRWVGVACARCGKHIEPRGSYGLIKLVVSGTKTVSTRFGERVVDLAQRRS